MDIKQTLAKLQAVIDDNSFPHEVATAKRLYDKIKSKYNITEADLDPQDVKDLRQFGITFTQADGWTTYNLDTSADNNMQIEQTLYHILTKKARLRKEQNKRKLLLPNGQTSKNGIEECEGAKEEGK